MKATRRHPAVIPQMALIALVAALGACVPAAVRPPRARPAPPPRVVQQPAPLPAVGDWRDMPQTPGDWSWSRDVRGVSQASFGNALSLVCVQPGQVRLTMMNRAGAVTIRTTSVTRAIGTTASQAAATSSQANATADLQAADPLLDAMAFSRGRFALDFRGNPPLIVPSWPEIGRVIEDCR